MIVTETKLTELTGYTKSEIKNRRQRHWIAGTHYVYDPAGKVVYNVQAITAWQKASLRTEVSAESVSMLKGVESFSAPISHLPRKASSKPTKYV